MEPTTLIIAALTLGATEFAKGSLGEAGKDAYNSLKGLMLKHFAQDEKAKRALADHEEDPDAYEKPLQKAITQNQVEQDHAVLKQAEALLKAADPDGAAQGKYTVSITGGQGNQVGDGNTQNNNFGMPPVAP